MPGMGDGSSLASNWSLPCVLEGRIIRLEPLLASHAPALAEIGLEPELWRLQPRPVRNLSEMEAYAQSALDDQRLGLSLPFVIIRRDTNVIVGTTRYMDIAPEHRRLEIGATWITATHQRTGANVEAKLLLLAHAFDVLGVQKVVLKTEAANTKSRDAILAIGAREEGTLRSHFLADSGRCRDMVYFSILEPEWAAVRQRNEDRLRRWSRPALVGSGPASPESGATTVRSLEPDDFEAIVSRIDDWWGRPVRSQLPRLFFEHFTDTSFVVEEAGKVVAFLIGFLSPAQREVAYIHFAGVDPQFRGQGIARDLYGRFAAVARAAGRTRIRAITSPENSDSIRFHRQLGFQLEPSNTTEPEGFAHKRYGPNGEPRVLMTKDLS